MGLLALLHAGARIVLPPNSQPGTLTALRAEAPVLVSDHEGDVVLGSTGPVVPLGPLDPTACGMDFFTSGSTGDRKRIGKTLAQLECEVATLEALWGEALGDAPVLGMVSHQHIFGLTFRLLWPAMAGRLFAAHSHFAWESLLAALDGPSVLVASPAHLTRLGGVDPLSASRRPRMILTAGAPLPLEAAQETSRILGTLPTEIFGSTETGAIAWRRQHAADVAWRPLPGVEVIASDAGTLDIRSPFLPVGEIHHSADRAELVPGGFHFAGRADRVVKIEGKRVGLTEVERDLCALDAIDAAAVVATDGSLGAVAVLTPSAQAALARDGKFRFVRTLRRALLRTQEAAAVPRHWRFVAALPVDGMGKQDRRAIERLLQDVAPSEPIVTAVREDADADAVELDLRLPPGLRFFEGHFDGFPILPGVVQVHWALDLARRHLGLRDRRTVSAQVKFRRPIRPDASLTLRLVIRRSGAVERLMFAYHDASEACSSGTIGLAA